MKRIKIDNFKLFHFLYDLKYFSLFGLCSFLFCLNFAISNTLEKDEWCYYEVLIPAEYGVIKKEVFYASGLGTIDEIILIKEESIKIIPMLCEKDLTKFRLRKIRRALKRKGYDATPTNHLSLDNVLIDLTLFQKDHDLTVGIFSLETMEELGVQFRFLNAKKSKIICHEYYDEKRVPCICGKDITKATIRKIKRKLKERGYDIVESNNGKEKGLKNALNTFQKDNNLPIDPAIQSINIRTFELLNIKY